MINVIVIGGGPAGMAAALSAADHGARVTVIENRGSLGGQYWRSADGEPITGKDGSRGESLRREVLHHPNIKVRTLTSVWNATNRDGVTTVRVTSGSSEEELQCDRLIVATGAHDRVLPFPGWTLPGVMTAGGIQALLKGQGVLAGKRVVLAGTGPFLLSVAAGLVDAGAKVTIVEANSMLRWAKHPWVLLTNPSKIKDAIYYRRKIRGVKVLRNQVREVIKSPEGLQVQLRNRTLSADVLGVGYGFTPDLSVLLALGAKTTINDGNLVVDSDTRQMASTPNVFVAGEVTGIGGVEASLIEGQIAGLAAVGAPIPFTLKAKRGHWSAFARALADVYALPEWTHLLKPDTVICRCEEVTVAKIDDALSDLGASDPRSVKLFARTGMGLCQGRFCSQSVAAVVASRGGVSDLLSQRPIVTPVPLGLIAQDANGKANNDH